MKSITLSLIALLFSSAVQAKEVRLSDKELLELGYTPVQKSIKKSSKKGFEFNPNIVNKAEVVVIVDKSKKGTTSTAQTAQVFHKGTLLHTFKVSTGTEKTKWSSSGKIYKATTPEGYFRPTKIYKDYFSYTWGGAPMEHAVFFKGGIALHATTPDHYREIGQRDSGGCVRFMPKNAKIVNELILETGKSAWELIVEPIKVKIKKWKFFTKEVVTFNRTRVSGHEVDVPLVYSRTGNLSGSKTVESVDTIIVVVDKSKL